MNWYRVSTGQFGYPQPLDTYYEETYDPSVGCPTCEIGKRLRNPFRFRSEPKARHSQFLGLNWVFDEIFVRDVVKEVFEEERVTGVEFTRPVLHKSGEPVETIHHMQVRFVLPPGLQAERVGSEKCEMPADQEMFRFLTAIESRLIKGPFCGAVKYNYPQGEKNRIVMRAEAFTSVPDIVRMSEWFGSGGSAGRPILVSQRIKDIVRENKWRGLFFERVEIA